LKYSEIAKEEGFIKIANLFSATSKSDAIHAFNYKKSLEKLGIEVGDAEIGNFEVKSTNENIIESINIKALESNSTYPKYIKTSEFEKAKDATKAFKWARDSGLNFKETFKKVLIDFRKNNGNLVNSKYYICPTCGNIYEDGNLTDACDLCSTSAERYIIFEVK
jgi:rubrerythrin